jgi:L-threonylcarbamoyladenylate synthase
MPSYPNRIRTIDPLAPDPSVILAAADIIRAGGVIVFPTRNLYGLGADAFNADAVVRVFRIKRRPPDNPVSILIRSRADVDGLVAHIPAAARKLMDRFWPGRMTIVFAARPEVPPALTAGTGKIGIRVPQHPAAVALTAALDRPITGTSANLSGMPGVHRISDLPEAIIKNVDLVLDAGDLKIGIGSTVVDVTIDPPQVLREGEVCMQELTAIF